MKNNLNKNGFTLVELAIVIVIIGLLVGGVLQGQALIRQSKIHTVTAAAESYKSAINSFRGKYNCLPGDCINATKFFTDVSNGDGNNMINYSYGAENLQAWKQLGLSNFIKGTYSGTGAMTGGVNVPLIFDNVVSNVLAISGWSMGWVNTDGTDMNHLSFGVVEPSTGTLGNWQPFLEANEIYSIDLKMDDGLPGKGLIRVHSPNANIRNSSLCSNSNDANIATYQIANNGINCGLAYLLKI